jgi:hypothetical protein
MCSECFRGFLHREFHQASVLLGSHRCCDEVTEIVTAPIINVVIVIGYYYNLFMKSLPMYWETPHMWEVFPHRKVFPYLGTLSIHGGGLPICRGALYMGSGLTYGDTMHIAFVDHLCTVCRLLFRL